MTGLDPISFETVPRLQVGDANRKSPGQLPQRIARLHRVGLTARHLLGDRFLSHHQFLTGFDPISFEAIPFHQVAQAHPVLGGDAAEYVVRADDIDPPATTRWLSPRDDRNIEKLSRPDEIGVSQAIGRSNDPRGDAKGLGNTRDRIAALHSVLMDRGLLRGWQAGILVEQYPALAGRHPQSIRRAVPRRRNVLTQLGVEVVQYLAFNAQELSRRFQIDIRPVCGQDDFLVCKGRLFSLGLKTKKLWVFGHDGRGHEEWHVVPRFAGQVELPVVVGIGAGDGPADSSWPTVVCGQRQSPVAELC